MLILPSISRHRAIVLVVFLVLVSIIIVPSYGHGDAIIQDVPSSSFQHIRAPSLPSNKNQPDPIQWLAKNSNNKYAVASRVMPHIPGFGEDGRPRAALISLVRNSELEGMMQSMRQLEYRWNSKYKVS
jgi:alpha 1,2-mannosyltransferase